MVDLRIFSYLPNPRIWKATIAARLNGVELEIVGDRPPALADWLWDPEPRLLPEAERTNDSPYARQARKGFGKTLYKTEAFLDRVPFGTVPCAFSPDGAIGIFESNSILRAVARLGEAACPLYGRTAYETSRIDSFLDVTLSMAKDSQTYLLALNNGKITAGLHSQMAASFDDYQVGLEQTLKSGRPFLATDELTIADICFAAEICQLSRERGNIVKLRELGLEPVINAAARAAYPLSFAHFDKLRVHEAFAPDIQPFMDRLDERYPLNEKEGVVG